MDLIDEVKEELEMFIRGGENLVILERIDTETNEKDVAIRIEDSEYSLSGFMQKIKFLFREMQERNNKLCEDYNNIYDQFEKYRKNEKDEVSIADLNQAMDLSNIK